jgi:hypothetical protein
MYWCIAIGNLPREGKKIIENPKSIWADMRFPYEPACCRLVGQYGRAGLFDLHGPDRLLL